MGGTTCWLGQELVLQNHLYSGLRDRLSVRLASHSVFAWWPAAACRRPRGSWCFMGNSVAASAGRSDNQSEWQVSGCPGGSPASCWLERFLAYSGLGRLVAPLKFWPRNVIVCLKGNYMGIALCCNRFCLGENDTHIYTRIVFVESDTQRRQYLYAAPKN